MPWTDPNNWFAAIFGALGSPFALPEGEGQPKMNKTRTVEGLIITVVGALLSSAAVAFMGYLYLVPEIKQETALLRQSVVTHAKELATHKSHAMRLRTEDREDLHDATARIEKSLNKIDKKLEKHDNDFYQPMKGG